MRDKLIVCIGAALADESFLCKDEPQLHTSNPAVYNKSAGGVARNIAHHLAMLGNQVELITHFGNDDTGHWLKKVCADAGIGLSHSVINEKPTGRYTAILSPDGNLYVGAAAASFEEVITIELLKDKSDLLKTASLIMIDCNLSEKCLEWIIDFCRKENKSCVVEPVSIHKAARLRNVNLNNIFMITPNRDELYSLLDRANDFEIDTLIQELTRKEIQNIWIRNGKEGSTFYTQKETFSFSPAKINIVDVTGAGDAALAGWIHANQSGKQISECLTYGHSMAELILLAKGAVLENLNIEILETKVKSLKNNIKQTQNN